ncbi:trypsin-like peptidase domain-containing protein [Ruminiclostridium herbifermentans]|uniref:Trypsin-like peptidase domain-containing protein n=1 Tax=Ruminiclostridium herbifermentans TaxID=2488810 RepID=A0A4U7JMC3_9FIRM|nr:trypsin-like peptidase domain-containing protein [Ruminiclostridium herbifermentans]QNU65495.1 trypsin-like peptidase domain-containing protein [Ruminiclostridium herbifermentans]
MTDESTEKINDNDNQNIDTNEDNNNIQNINNNEVNNNKVSNENLGENGINNTNSAYSYSFHESNPVNNGNTSNNIAETSNENQKYEGNSSASYNNRNYEDTQKTLQNQNLNTSYNGYNLNMNSYYKENFKKTNNKKSDAWKYILVSLVSAIVGAAIVSAMLIVVAPALQPQIKKLLGISTQENSNIGAQTGISEIKKVEIVQTGESAVTSVAEKVGPSVVGIRASYQNTNEFFGSQADFGEGSGIIISTDGYILTNHHVIERSLNNKTRDIRAGSQILVYLPSRIDKPYKAEIKGYDSKTDLAVLKINEGGLPAIEFGDSDTVKVGEPAIAFGNPGGLEYMGSLTTGVISGLNRTVQLDGGKKIRLIQTDAAINPGNSGGALVNIKGQLIGVNTIKMVATGFEGLGFAIPVNDAKKIADELIKNTYISKPYLGIYVDNSYTEEIARENNLPMGVFVADVEILGAAQKAGIRALDIITKFNNVPVKSYDELEDEKNKFKPGDVVEVEIYRDGNRKKLKVTLGETK